MSEARFAKAIRSLDVETMEILLKKEPDLVNSKVSGFSLSLSDTFGLKTEKHDDGGDNLFPSPESWLEWCFWYKSHNNGRYCECVKLLVNHGADINNQHSNRGLYFSILRNPFDGFTPVLFAVQVKCMRCLRFLIEKGADLSNTALNVYSALTSAIQIEAYALASYLIQHSTPALINKKDKDWMTALMWATQCTEQAPSTLIQQLIEAGADLSITDIKGNTVLMLAIEKRARRESVKVFIQQSTPTLINHRNKDGMTALMLVAAWSRQEDPTLIQQLIEAGADPNIICKNGNTALMLAVESENDTVAKALIQHSTPKLINHRDSYGMTALMSAVESRQPDACSICQLLIEAGADLNVADEDGKTALMRVFNEFSQDKTSMCSQLIKAGANLNTADKDGNTALLLALKNKQYFESAKLLIQHSTPALINHRDKDGRTGLMWVLLHSPIKHHFACSNNFSERQWASLCVSLCKHLIEAGADVNLKDNDGETALSIALERELEDTVTLLLEVGAIVNTMSIYGLTPLYYALKMKNLNILNQLLKKNADPTLSRKHTHFIHTTLLTGNVTELRMLVINGFPPLDCTFPDDDNSRHTYNLLHSASPLYLALWSNKPSTARYLITNKFFTRSDFNRNSLRSKELRQRLEKFRAKECSQILIFHLQTVQTLSTLCLVTISSALTQDFWRDNVGEEASSTEWRFTPTFKGRVESLGLPPKLQRALLHQTPSSKICCGQWSNILLEEERQFQDCNECFACTL